MGSVSKRLLILFLVIFVVTASGDVWTTELGRRLPNTIELNPWGFQPLGESIRTEIVICLIGCLMVACGAWLSADLLNSANELAFWPFFRQFASRYSTLVLVFAPITVATMRIVAIVNNGSQLVWGWSPFNFLEVIAAYTSLSDAQSLCIFLALAGGMFSIPIVWVIYVVARGR